MNRVLRGVALAPTPRELRAGEPVDTPEVQAAIAAAEAAGYERGLEDGTARERGEGLALAAAVQEALEAAAAHRRAEVEEHAGELLRSALELAERVVGHAPHDDGAALEARVRAAVGGIDDAPLEVVVHPVDAARLERVAAADPRLEVATDPGLRPGEARIRGPWAQADLTRAAALAAARAALP